MALLKDGNETVHPEHVPQRQIPAPVAKATDGPLRFLKFVLLLPVFWVVATFATGTAFAVLALPESDQWDWIGRITGVALAIPACWFAVGARAKSARKVNELATGAYLYLTHSLLVLAVIYGAVAVVMVFVRGPEWVSKWVYQPSLRVNVIALFSVVPVSLFALIFRRARLSAFSALVLCSVVCGFSLWAYSLYVAATIGLGWLIAGVLFAGLGVIPIALIASCIAGQWAAAGGIAAVGAVFLALRFGGLYGIGKLAEGSQFDDETGEEERPTPVGGTSARSERRADTSDMATGALLQDSGLETSGLTGSREREEATLFAALSQRDTVQATKLIASHPWLVESTNSAGASPLYVAARRGLPEVVRCLLLHGASVDAKLSTEGEQFSVGDTPLVAAIQGGCIQSLGLLIENGASLDFANKWGWSPLTVAMEYQNREAFERLLQAKADPNFDIDGRGLRALHVAAISAKTNASSRFFVSLLLRHGADPSARLATGETAWDLAPVGSEARALLAEWLNVT